MSNPGLDDLVGGSVVAKGFEKDLPASIELASEDPVRTVGFVQRSAAVLDRRAEVFCGMLVLEALDSIPLGTRKEKSNHHVVEAALDEIVDNRSQLGLSAELFE